MTNLGFIGAGRMATALARGCVQAKLLAADQVLASDPVEASRQKFAAEAPGAKVSADNATVMRGAETIVLAVKPQMMTDVLRDIKPHVTPRHLLISIAAGIPISRLSAGLPSGTRLVRVMPNTPCLIACGASCFSRGPTATAEDAALVLRLLASVGKAYEVEENQLDAVTGLSGSGPAFVYTVIEALADGGERVGLPAELALELAAQTAAGAAAMVLQTGLSPGELRNQVTSPGGTTLAGLKELDRRDGAGAFRAAVEAATRRSVELGQA
jgi:pyrroline-5-carboxylate reductase